MKILMVNKFLHPNGGSETYIFKLGDELKRQGHEVQYFGMEHDGRCVGNSIDEYTSDMDFHGGNKLTKIVYPFKVIYSKEAAKKITYVLEDFVPDVVHINNFNFQLTPSILYATKRWSEKNNKSVKIVYTAHDGQLVCPNHLMQQYVSNERCEQCIVGSPWKCAINRCIHGSILKSVLGSIEASVYRFLKTYRMIDTVICPSAFLKSKLDNLPELANKTVVIHNFVDQKQPINAIGGDYFLYFGRYSKEKGVDTLLKVCERYPNVKFVFAGNGPLEEVVNSHKNVENMGFLQGEELVNVISGAKMVIFPSECNENCPFSVMEALSCGIPVIASKIGGVPELVIENVNGVLFEPHNIEQLYSSLLRLIENKLEFEKLKRGALATRYTSLAEYAGYLLNHIY